VKLADIPTLLPIPHQADSRGTFAKPFSDADGTFQIRELFWTRSSRGSIRGMHFQTPPHDLHKLVWVSRGSIVDVVVDVRRHSGFGAVTSFELSADEGSAVWVPSGFAHGFQALEDDTVVNYAVDAVYAPQSDTGVRWDSVSFSWPLAPGAISERDAAFVALDEFQSPFGFGD
jgi:dTDP-4-dehydrorhamnose 3,5-epimerase